MNALYTKFIEVAHKYPDDLCTSDYAASFTYHNIFEKIEEYQKKITAIENSCAIIYLPKSAEIIAWQLALNAKKIAFLTLEWGQESRKKAAIDQIKPSFIVTEIDNQIVIINFKDYKIYPSQCAYIVFSSGSTGSPKKIMLKDEPVVEVVMDQAKIIEMDHEKCFLWMLNPAFDASLSDIYVTLFSGAHLVITQLKPNQLKGIALLINKYKVTHSDIPPVVFPLLLKFQEKNPFHSLKYIIFGGEIADEKICHSLCKYFNLYNAYGPTETTICSSMCQVTSSWMCQDIGIPLKNVIYKIVSGELHIGGTHCALGYENPILDKKFYFEDEKQWFITGDMIENNNNKYYYSGRKDRQFKHFGQLVCPEEIEVCAQKCGAYLTRVKYQDNKIILSYSGELFIDKLKILLPSWMMPQVFEPLGDMEDNINHNWKVTK